MVYEPQCSLEARGSIFSHPIPLKFPSHAPNTNPSQSFVRDNRLEGNVRRCGFPGAPCTVESRDSEICPMGGQCWHSIKDLVP